MTTHLTVESLGVRPPPTERQDVVLVGAGMSSLYIAWRLLQEDPSLRIAILERINRTGGRLDSNLIDFGRGNVVKEEQGGMRFTFDAMDDLMALFLTLGIEEYIVPFPMSSMGNNRLYFRGHAFTNREGASRNHAIWSEIYGLESPERGIDPKSIINSVFNRILAQNPDFPDRPDVRTPEFWQRFRLMCKWNGQPLVDWSLWNILCDMGYSNECITLLYRLLGFNGTFLSEMNAGEAYQLLEDFPANPKFHTLRDGFGTLPTALAKAIGTERIHLLTNVDAVDANPACGGYVLSCSQTDRGGKVSKHEVTADKVVLGLPRLALEELFIRSDAFNRLEPERSATLWNALQSATNQPLLKINLYYDSAWWGNSLSGQPPVSFGPNFSDLPLGSVYPFYTVDEALAAALEYRAWLTEHGGTPTEEIAEELGRLDRAKYDRPAALTIYCDFVNINFWRALQGNGELFDSELQRRYTEQKPQTVYAASRAVVHEATRLFKLLFNTRFVPEPKLTSARIWSGATRVGVEPAEQVGFGVHQWGLGARDDEVMATLVEPLDNLYTCGEAYSDYQGWVEGALRSADRVLAQGFGLDPIAAVFEREHRESSSDAIKRAYQSRATERIRKHIDRYFDPDGEVPHPGEALDEGYGLALTYFDR